ncbi:MAG: amidohydrolase family protein [Thermoanaerobaculia bacterium]
MFSAADVRGGDTYAFVDVNVIPMTGRVVLRQQTVVVAEDTIVAIGPSARVPIPADAVTIDGRGRSLMPGLTDAHVHLFTAPELSLYVANGVTAVFNLNGAPAHLRWKQAIAEGRMTGPAIYSTGPTFMSKRPRAEAEAAVAEQAAAGYDGVKIYNGVGADEYGALVASAKARRMLVIGHVPREVGAETALRAGQSIAHAEEFVYSEHDLRQLRRALPFQRKLVRALNAAGVPLLAGSDATAIGPVAGFSLHEELAELVRSGLTPYDALRTATVNPARYLQRIDRYGTVEAGKAADLVLVEGNPLADIRSTARIVGVMRNGAWHDAAALRRMVAAVPAGYANAHAELLRRIGTDLKAAESFVRESDPFGILGGSALAELASNSTPEELQALFARLERAVPDAWLAREESLNELGYTLLMNGRPLQAVAVFEANAARHPRSANVFDSLAEGYFKAGRVALAVETYGKALAVEPEYGNAPFARKFIEEHAGSDAAGREVP